MPSFRNGAVVALMAATASLAGDQEREPGFAVKSRLVLVPVNVTDAKGRNVESLTAEDFEILDNGQAQAVTADATVTADSPISLAIAVQSSGISAAALAKVRKVGAMIPALITGDRGCALLFDFAAHVRLRQDCTGNADSIVRAFAALNSAEPRSGRMLDAVNDAVERLARRSNSRRVLLLISEAKDRGSETPLGEALMNAQLAGVTVYALTYSAFRTAWTTRPSDAEPASISLPPPWVPRGEPGSPPGRERVPVPPVEQRGDLLGGIGELGQLSKVSAAKVLADGTGGEVFSFARQKGLEDAIEKLGAGLHTQYMLAFAPRSPNPGYHHLTVRLKRPGSYRIRARPGYWLTGAEATSNTEVKP